MATFDDIAHFKAIASGEAATEDERIDRALEVSPGERILMGFSLGLEAPFTPAHLAEMDSRADGQMELARRRIALGLSREPCS